MKHIRIITDSGSDIPQNRYENVTVLPMTIHFGNREYQDGVTITNDQFYNYLIESDQLPTTSLVSPAAFEDAFQIAEHQEQAVIVITISSALSGTYQSATVAAEDRENIFIIDSKNVSIGQQLLVLRARQLIDAGVEVQDIVKQLTAEREKIHTLAVLNTLEYLKKGGRISGTTAFVGELLSIKPVVAVREGAVCMLGKARGSKNGNNYLMKEIESSAGVDFSKPVCLGYTGLDDTLLTKYIEDSSRIWQGHRDCLKISSIGATIGTHIGPGAIAVSFIAKE